jgi:flavin-dependent dehydrogenase
VVDPIGSADGLQGFMLSDGRRLRADVVIGADGALSRVATAASLVDPSRVLWGFAVSAYVEELVRLPHIVLWEPEPWRIFPGYGWLFPGVDGYANVGLGLGLRADRSGAVAATDWFDAFIDHLRRLGVLSRRSSRRRALRGGWLKMGMIGTIPARRWTLLVGDAAGLVNPLQGEGISQAMRSGRAAAEAVLAGPDAAATRYSAFLAATYAPFDSVTAAAQSAMLKRPRLASAVGRVLTAPVLSHALRGGWSI